MAEKYKNRRTVTLSSGRQVAIGDYYSVHCWGPNKKEDYSKAREGTIVDFTLDLVGVGVTLVLKDAEGHLHRVHID